MRESGEIVLQTHKVNKHFPGVHALKDVDFNLRKGEIHGLVGHNGAGKSTLVKVLTGSYAPENGDIMLYGSKVHFKDERDAINKGIGTVSQEGSLVPTYTGLENILLGNESVAKWFLLENEMKERGQQLLDSFGIQLDLTSFARDMSPASRKLLEIFKIMSHDPSILIFDEPTAALSDMERQLVFKLMRQQRDKGYGIIFISHYIDEVVDLCDRITVMRDGNVIDTLDGTTATKAEIVRLMINREQKTEFVEKHAEISEPALEVLNASDGNVVKDVSFFVRYGEIVGIFGTVGSGRTEVCEIIFGASRIKNGEVRISGKPVLIKSVRQAIKAGVSMIPEDRLTKALILSDSVSDNLSLPFIMDNAKASFINRKKERAASAETVNRLNIITSGLDMKVNNLSGGNKQKVSFGRWVVAHKGRTKLFIFDEPTEGVDVGAKAEMYRIIVDLAEQGASCLVVSSDISEIMGLCDRIYVMRDGKTVGEFNKKEPDLQKVIITASIGA